MKRHYLFSFLLFVCGCVLHNSIKPEDRWGSLPSFKYGEMIGKTYNNVFKNLNDQKLNFYCDPQWNTTQIYVPGFIYYSGITLNDENRSVLVQYINKYFEWNKLAIKENTTLEKEIGRINVPLNWRANNSDEWYRGDVDITVGFFSQNAGRHQLTIAFSEAKASVNYYITNKLETIYLDKNDVDKLSNLLSIEVIKKEVEKQNAKATTEAKFK